MVWTEALHGDGGVPDREGPIDLGPAPDLVLAQSRYLRTGRLRIRIPVIRVPADQSTQADPPAFQPVVCFEM